MSCARTMPFLLLSIFLLSCSDEDSMPENTPADAANEDASSADESRKGVQSEPLGESPDGDELTQFYLTNANGIVVGLTNYGAIITEVRTPDRDGEFANITLRHQDVSGYWTEGNPYFGSIVGRYGNRIAKGKFTIDGTEYTLATNNGNNHLHGGETGFNKRTWVANVLEDSIGVRFTYSSPDGEEGYPGTLTAKVTYTLTDADELRIDYEVVSDKDTHANLTNHAYWNLAGAGSNANPILDHRVVLNADRYVEVDGEAIPTGQLPEVAGTPMDFRKAESIGARIDEVTGDPGGYDHCWVINDGKDELQLAARVTDPSSGRVLEILTTEPGVQFYTGNFLKAGDGESGYQQRCGFCLETQRFPDSPNQPHFPTSLLKKGEIYTSTTVHKFSVEKE